MSDDTPSSPLQKALTINLDPCKYGTIAEIGAGQEVARTFFQAGGAAGTVAKAMSAYDMQFSDAIYGETSNNRYVTEERLEAMLEREFNLILERITESRPKQSTFFAFADTVSARSYRGPGENHGWMGVSLQLYPGAEPSEIKLHVRMLDETNQQQQDALGVLGVNLIFGAYSHFKDPHVLINSLMDTLDARRVKIDIIKFSGPYFEDVDDHLMGLYLVQSGFTDAVVFGPDGQQALAADAFYKKNLLILRGSLRPITNVNLDMIACATEAFKKEPGVDENEISVFAELTMAQLSAGGDIDIKDFLARVRSLGKLKLSVIISNYLRYFRLREYINRYTKKDMGIIVGIRNIRDIFDEKFYDGMEGGILAAFGKLFTGNTKLYVYPEKHAETGEIVTGHNVAIKDTLKGLYDHLLANEFLTSLEGYDESVFGIDTREVLSALKKGDGPWRESVPAEVVEHIIENRLFGFGTE